MKSNGKKIGIIGGVGPQSTNFIYKKIIAIAQKKYGAKNNDDYPEIVIHSVPIPDFISDEAQVPNALSKLILSTKLLERTECTAIAIGSNTVHVLKDKLQQTTSIPFISIIDLVAQKCSFHKYKSVALLGSPVLMKSGIYENELIKRNISLLTPHPDEYRVLDHMIRSVLAGKREHLMRDKYIHLINRLYREGAEAVILGCTELPLAINYEALGDRAINSDAVLAEGLVDYYYQ